MQPYLALITPLSHGGQPSHPIYSPIYPDQGLPPVNGSGGSPSHPIYHPGHPDHGLPARPDQGLPGGGAQPQPHAAVQESDIPAHPDKPTGDSGEWILVALGDGTVGWAWMDSAAQPKG